MPTTISGLVIFAILLVPGFLHYVQRRSRIPQRTLSPLVETATLTTVSIATNFMAVAIFGLVRSLFPSHTPDVRRLVLEGSDYAAPRLGYLLTWTAVLLAMSSGFAYILAWRPGPLGSFSERFTPAIVDVSAWYHVFENGPEDKYVYVGCDLTDGSYVGGVLDWYSTELEETADRDFVLAEPITYRPPTARKSQIVPRFSRLVVSARDTTRLYVSYVDTIPAMGS